MCVRVRVVCVSITSLHPKSETKEKEKRDSEKGTTLTIT